MPSNPSLWHRKLFPTAHRLLLERAIRPKLADLTGLVLVIGAGYESYWDWLVSADHVCLTDISDRYGTIDRIADAHDLPFGDEHFDCAVAIEVFEHLHTPARAAAELFRVLKPGGRALISVPFMFRVHGDPFDFSRLTRGGLEALFASFSHMTVSEFGGRPHVISDILTTAATPLASLRLANHVLTLPLFGRKGSSDCPSGYCVELTK